MENGGVEGIAYYDGRFKTGIPEELLTFHYKKDQISLFLLISLFSTFDLGLLQMLLTINLFYNVRNTEVFLPVSDVIF